MLNEAQLSLVTAQLNGDYYFYPTKLLVFKKVVKVVGEESLKLQPVVNNFT